ncbi:MAG: 4-oxalocrotonate tautomerase [Omnitrophica WOR_2 bacterium RIFCSPHIGHO2_02_FULL_68_15]|nr:MAG: 4-oxalocrotonate tautomerase [Omnitrophica WOR_2 bacterium RIFCSPHIGHO2_02_FULL_68_15]
MPVITVELFEGRTKQQKSQYAKELTELTTRVLGTSTEHVWIIFRDTPKSEWAMGGELCG